MNDKPKQRINIFGLSGGKDSTALWAWAIHESGYPRESIIGTFCDTQNEYDEVYDQIAALDAYGQLNGVKPVVMLVSIGFLNLCIKKNRFPSARARFCTEELKIKPTQDYVIGLQQHGYEVVTHSGVRKSESDERATLEEWGKSGKLNCRERRPLLELSIAQVLGMHKKYGLPINPLYFTGRKRVGCKLCCMSTKQDIRITVKTRPEVIDQYREWERMVGKREGSTFHLQSGEQLKTYNSFFSATSVPLEMRSATYTREDGKTFKIATIDDVARWAFTVHGGKQGGFDFMFDDEPIFEIDDKHAPCKSGYCE